jgi:hypothetical protein
MCLRFVFLLIARVTAGLRLSRREEMWKTAEILILRHQLAVLERRQPRRPKLNWADRALFAALLGVIPKARRQGLRLLVTPDTIMRWHAAEQIETREMLSLDTDATRSLTKVSAVTGDRPGRPAAAASRLNRHLDVRPEHSEGERVERQHAARSRSCRPIL